MRMHSDSMEDVEGVGAGEILAMFGVDCSSGDTFTDGTTRLAMSSMHVPDPVMSLAIKPKNSQSQMKFGKALNRFQKVREGAPRLPLAFAPLTPGVPPLAWGRRTPRSG